MRNGLSLIVTATSTERVSALEHALDPAARVRLEGPAVEPPVAHEHGNREDCADDQDFFIHSSCR